MKREDSESFRLWEIYKSIQPGYIQALHDDERALAQIGPQFLGFVDIYKHLAEIIPKGRAIYDFGCCYAPQSFYFREHAFYIGVDEELLPHPNFPNAQFHVADIRDFLRNHWHRKGSAFAICSYVPDPEAMRLVREAFEDVFTFYPSESDFPPILFPRRPRETIR